MTAPQWKVHSGCVIGYSHHNDHRNNQDHVQVRHGNKGELNEFVVGVVCDGCSEGRYSEFGANWGSNFIANKLASYVSSGISPIAILPVLYKDITNALNALMDSLGISNSQQRAEYVQDNLLFTIAGFAVTHDEVVTFTAGDGVVQVNDDRIIIDQNNTPKYIAYHCVSRKYLTSQNIVGIPPEFAVQVFTAADVNKLMVATDGLEYLIETDPDRVEDLWKLKHTANLQRRLNVASWNDRILFDDTTVITCERQVREE